jgi:spermidine synthase
MSSARAIRVAPLLFASGFCALIYQTVWLREFRLFFGASTAATSAVLAIFMGGLGFGGALLGRRVESVERPLRFYAQLELMIGLTAAVTPALIALMRYIYIGLGGTMAMGLTLGTIVRLLMSAVVLGVPTFLMGGTLPAVARATVGEEDINRRLVALLYGMNTLGAVIGTLLSTFYLLEKWGNSLALMVAAIFNVGIALMAFSIAKQLPAIQAAPRKPVKIQQSAAPPAFVYIASAVAGFVFLLMEIVWYRMLCSILSASTFTFGLILAVALLGIGLGGLIYAMWFGGRRIGLSTFALVSALEALCVAFPYALGDQVALVALLLRPLGVFGFGGFVTGWAVVCLIVVLPAAIVAGVQFPMLIALLGKGRTKVGSQTGATYAWNTLGAIAGSLAGVLVFCLYFPRPECGGCPSLYWAL